MLIFGSKHFIPCIDTFINIYSIVKEIVRISIIFLMDSLYKCALLPNKFDLNQIISLEII